MAHWLKKLASHWDTALIGVSLVTLVAMLFIHLQPRPVFDVTIDQLTALERQQLPPALTKSDEAMLAEQPYMPQLVDVRGVKAPAVAFTASGEGMVPFKKPPARHYDKKVVASVNVNTASAKQLERLPGVGPKLASRIIAFRKANGLFATVDDLLKVDGIGPGKLAKMRQYTLLR